MVYNREQYGGLFMSQSNRNRKRKASRRPDARALFSNPIFAVGIVIVAVLLFVLLRRSAGGNNGYFCEGVSINSVDMSVYTKSEGEQMLNSWADKLINRKYQLTYENLSWTFSPKDVDASINTEAVLEKAWNLGHTGSANDRNNTMMNLRYSPQALWTEFTYSEKKLDEFIQTVSEAVYVEPIDADILVTSTRPVVLSESKDGRALDADALRETLLNAMQNGADEIIPLPVENKLPAVSSDDAENGLQLIAEYSTSLKASSSKRRGNVKLALSNFNGFALRPGETVSFNNVVGQRTTLRGYVEAPVYYGDTVTSGVGGGVCQASSTLYGALLKSGMDFIERHNHTMVVAYCEASTDAAVSEDASQDLVFTNNTESTIYLYTNVNSEAATVMVYSRKPEYRIELVSTILTNNIKNPNIATVKDETGTYAWYTDEYTLKSEGKLGRKSMLERVYYDWDTGLEVKRETMSDDYYLGERDTYYVGIHTKAPDQ